MDSEAKKPMAILRFQKLKRTHGGSHSIWSSIRHLEKHQFVAEISHPKRTCLNEFYSIGTHKKISDLMRNCIKNHNEDASTRRRFRSNAAIGIEAIMTFSPEIIPENCSNEDLELFLKMWNKSSQEWLKETFPEMKLVSYSLHCDETTPHLHIVFLPIKNNKISASAYLGDRKKLSLLQDSYAECMSRFGLFRGKKRVEEYEKWFNEAVNYLKIRGLEANHQNLLLYINETGNQPSDRRIHTTKQEWIEREEDKKAEVRKTEEINQKGPIKENECCRNR